jgi:hypothetical protein
MNVFDKVFNEPDGNVKNTIWDRVSREVRDQVWDGVMLKYNQVWSNVFFKISDQLYEKYEFHK